MAKRKVEGFVNIGIDCHPTNRHLARKWWVCCRDCRPKDSVTEEAQDAHEYRPVAKVKQAARRKARHLFRKIIGRNPEESELRWSMNYLQFRPGDRNIKSAPQTAWVARLSCWGNDTPTITGPVKLKFNPILQHWVGDGKRATELREAAVGLGEYVHQFGARFADSDKAKVEQWVTAVKTTLTALDKTFEEEV